MNFNQLANPYISSLTPYQPGKPTEELEREMGITQAIKLASNENPLGASNAAIEAANEALNQLHIYPDSTAIALKNKIAKKFNLEPSMITLGNGSENLFEIIIKTFLAQSDNAIISQYAFITIASLLQSYNVPTKIIPTKDWHHDLPAMAAAIDARTKMIFIVNPNNPTGTYENTQKIRDFLKQVRGNILVVLDEAYYDYLDPEEKQHHLSLLDDFPNVIITRTFSKAYGLAGLRIGYAFSHPHIAHLLNQARLPFNVNSIAIKAAAAALSDEVFLLKTLSVNQQGLLWVQEKLDHLDLKYIASSTNFITIDVWNGEFVYQALLKKKIIVRPLNTYRMPRHIRVSIGLHEQNEKFLHSLKEVLASDELIESTLCL